MFILVEVVFPVFAIFFAGFVLRKKFGLQIDSLSQTAFYLLLPCLVFRTLYEVDIKGDLKNIIIFQFFLMLFLAALVLLIGKLRKQTAQMTNGLLLSTIFMNAGNYGGPFILFALGEVAFQLAIAYWVIQTILMNTLGVFIANKQGTTLKATLIVTLKMPIVYAAILGIGLQLLELTIPMFLFQPVDMLATATIPIIMLLLGMQLANVTFTKAWSVINYGIILRLVISPVLAFLIVQFIMNVDGLLSNVLILQAAMPSAVVMTLIATKYYCEPEAVSGITLITTIVSMITLPLILFLL
ncbi:AEC family transporter [Halalkalibacter krulwichiae]|uniref:Membrane transport protein n=1 Tax=Halalkalibacter krulwichiae TaxID=199441 RepID=A0A1X9M8Q6_9BACI|nr:AEC family transporter [Halalkalibacter krulwichiae]ARK29805.1 Membrane transport protein [Halalkalibacter krulwichiae]